MDVQQIQSRNPHVPWRDRRGRNMNLAIHLLFAEYTFIFIFYVQKLQCAASRLNFFFLIYYEFSTSKRIQYKIL
jgi:hypothetical protein